jgi:hypothetical protein
MQKTKDTYGRAVCGAIHTYRLSVFLFLLFSAAASFAQILTLSTDGGAVVAGIGPFHSGFGNVNGLGIATPSAGITMLSSNFSGPGGVTGTLYTTPYGLLAVDGNPNRPSQVTAYITANFSKPTAVALYSCQVGGACTTTGGYVQMSTNSGAQTTIWAGIPAGGAGPSQGYLGLWIGGLNGASAFTGTDSVTIHYTLAQTSGPFKSTTSDLVLDLPQANIQDAVSLGFSQGATTVNGGAACGLGGSVVVGSASDVSFNLGSVDGLGVSTPTCGGKVAAVAVGAPSATYATSYKVTPAFSGITTSATPTATIALTSSGFTNSSTLSVQEGSSAAGMTAVPASGTTHAITTTVSNSAIERFLGVTILNNNSGAIARFPSRAAAGPFTASADAALITFTMVVN